MWMTILAAAGAFAAGCIVGGVTVYIVNLRKYHAQDMDVILSQIECVNENMEIVHENFKTGVERFGVFAETIEGHMKSLDEHVNAACSDMAACRAGFDSLKDSSKQLLEQTQSLDEKAARAADAGEQVLERMKLMV